MGQGGILGLEQRRVWWQEVSQGIRQGNEQAQVQGGGIRQILVRVQQGLGKVQRRKVAFPMSPSPTTPPPSQPTTTPGTSSKERWASLTDVLVSSGTTTLGASMGAGRGRGATSWPP